MTFPSQGAPQPGNQGYPGAPAQPGYVPNQQAGYSQAPQNYSGGMPTPGYLGGAGYPGAMPTPGYPGYPGYPGMVQVPQQKSKAGKVLLILGAVLVIVGIAIGAFTAMKWSDLALESSQKIGSESQVVTIAENKAKLIYLADAAAKGSEAKCSVLAPDGKTNFGVEGDVKTTITIGGRTYTSIAQLGGTDRANGDYVVRCTDTAYILDAETHSKVTGGILSFLACGAAIAFGLLLSVIGGIVALVTRRK